jgi:hypothetical protein
MIRQQAAPAVVMEEVTDPVQVAEARAQWERFDRNWAGSSGVKSKPWAF